MLKKVVAAVAVFACMSALAAGARAGVSDVEQYVSLGIAPTCLLSKPSTGGNFTFPTVDGLFSGTVTASAILNYQCSVGITPTLSLTDNIATNAPAFTLKGTANPSNTLPFNVYLGNNASGALFTDSASSVVPLSASASTAQQTLAFFASVNISANSVADSYTDTITATLNF